MRKWIVSLGVLAASTAFGASVPTCSSGTLASYIALTDGCQIGDKVFYGFDYSGGANVTSAGSVTVTPITTADNPGLQFGAFWFVNAGQSGDARIFFNVMVLPGGGAIEDDSLGLGGVSNLTGNSKIDVVEGVCLGQALVNNVCQGPTQNPVLEVTAPNQTNTYFKDIVFPNGATYTLLGITKDIGLFGGNTDGSNGASLSIITQQFSEVPVPEPVSILLFGSCLIAVAPIVRRKLR